MKKNSAFFLPYLFFLLVGGIALALYSKIDTALFINRHHNSAADLFFAYYTNIGLGYLVIPVILVLAFVRLRYVLMSAIAYLLALGITEPLKYMIDAPRPANVFEQLHQYFYHVPGVELYYWGSFPSGHATIAFCLFCLLALLTPSNFIKFLLFLAAFFVAYSRMYLSEHFLIDVYTGSLIGAASAILTYRMILNWQWLSKFTFIDKPLVTL